MKEYFEKSLQKIKELSRMLTEKEWNKVANQEGYLSSESLKYISGISFENLCREIILDNSKTI